MVKPAFTLKDGPVGKYAKFVEHNHGLIRGWQCVKARKLKERLGWDAKLMKCITVVAPNDLWECWFEDPSNRSRFGCLMRYPEEFTTKRSESLDPLGYNRAFMPPADMAPLPRRPSAVQPKLWIGRPASDFAPRKKPILKKKPTLKVKEAGQKKPPFRIRGQST